MTRLAAYQELALRAWPDAEWVEGEGRYAVVAPCGVVTVTLHKTAQGAEESKSFIDSYACGHACQRLRGSHEVVDLDDIDEPFPIRPATKPLKPKAVLLSTFPEEYQLYIEDIVTLPRPPKKWITVCDGMVQVVQRAWYEWYWARGIDPDKKRRKLPPGTRQAIIARDGLICGICGGDVDLEDVHIDHIIPVVQGGQDNPGNLRVTHSMCNIRKGAKV